ncbi:hypothetical protein TSAR_011186 [Trichomalopsis sarcophagae]|uniref:Protein kinase domain-containing protein n=1 Tax=Trichomalopsis sarcophagae TaxID=543379 RepID=A0A232F3C5_9HYME|nr:hypothetical protein TSAR_011186 [Trichomalopsis sarcophagae]
MDFVKKYCERGRGLRPRWANHGLEFLMLVCDPINTKYLTQKEFDQLKTSMDHCISHVVGSTLERDASSERENFRKIHGSRAPSPHCSSRTSNKSLSNNSPIPLKAVDSKQIKLTTSTFDCEASTPLYQSVEKMCRYKRVVLAVTKLEYEVDQKLRCRELIGQVVDRTNVDEVKIKVRRVNFTWQRGIKIGQGRFGKVYTVVNNQTGELLAMKEIQLQPEDYRAIKQVAEELQIFEAIQHKNLVRYHGVEIHREEMLIFMEFCAEGTLESLIAGSGNGLPESLLRKYTHQLLVAVSVLHNHGIVHRDIKTANIFLTDEGNCLKLGDFGSAVKIKSHTTMPGELQSFVGTQGK